jgi:hypothetical protein
MPRNYRGLFKIGDKAAGSITHVQVLDDFDFSCWPMELASYVERGLLPSYDDLPWKEDMGGVFPTRGGLQTGGGPSAGPFAGLRGRKN